MNMMEWVRLPTDWIRAEKLKQLCWKAGEGSDNLAGLMLLVAIAHHTEQDTGVTRLSYDQIEEATGISRAKIAAGLSVLEKNEILERNIGRSVHRLANYDKNRGWGKLPAKGLYIGKRIDAFDEFNLRKKVELDAMKIYLLFVAMRSNETNLAKIGFEKISEYTGVYRNDIKHAMSFLAASGLVYVEHVPSNTNNYGIANAYRLAKLEPYRHMGTTGRKLDNDIPF